MEWTQDEEGKKEMQEEKGRTYEATNGREREWNGNGKM
jgi:hypothetical protein